MKMTFSTRAFWGDFTVALVSSAMVLLMGLTDTIISGQFLGEKAIAGVGLCATAAFIAEAVSMLFSTGASVMFASAVSAFKPDRAKSLFGTGFNVSLLSGAIAAIIVYFIRDAVLGSFGADPETLSHASSYWTWTALVVLFSPIEAYLSSIVYVNGAGAACVVAFVLELVANAVVGVILCPLLGVSGCAIGSIAGLVAAVLVFVPQFFKKDTPLVFSARIAWRDSLEMLKLSISDASEPFLLAVTAFILNYFISTHYGPEYLAVAVVVNAAIAMKTVLESVPHAAQPMIETYFGEGNYERIVSLVKFSLRITVVLGLLLSAFVGLFPELVLETVAVDDPELSEVCIFALRLLSVSFVFHGLVGFFNSYYTFVGRPFTAFALTAVANFFAPVLLVPFFGIWFNEEGIGAWWGFAAYPIVAALFFFGAMRVFCRRGEFPYLLPVSAGRTETSDYDSSCDDADTFAAHAGFAASLVRATLDAIAAHNAKDGFHAELSVRGDVVTLRDDGETFDPVVAIPPQVKRDYMVAGEMNRVRFAHEGAEIDAGGGPRKAYVRPGTLRFAVVSTCCYIAALLLLAWVLFMPTEDEAKKNIDNFTGIAKVALDHPDMTDESVRDFCHAAYVSGDSGALVWVSDDPDPLVLALNDFIDEFEGKTFSELQFPKEAIDPDSDDVRLHYFAPWWVMTRSFRAGGRTFLVILSDADICWERRRDVFTFHVVLALVFLVTIALGWQLGRVE